jgi:glycosyltransferase involved in cell wall biosynthesis
VSIVIPVYNGANYLRHAVDSALAQTYPNVEVIVVDDGSNDGGRTDGIARSYEDRIRYFRQPNGGVSTALNVGLGQMKGEWFAWLSHDDAFAPDRVEQDMIVAGAHPEGRVFFSRIKIIDEEGKVVRDVRYPRDRVTNPREALSLGGVDMCSMTIHRSCFDRTGPFNEANRMTQDVEMTLRLSTLYPFTLSPRAVTLKRDHPSRNTRARGAEIRRDVGLLMDFIHDQLSVEAFFPSLRGDPDDLAEAWVWMGDLYRQFGAKRYAEEAFQRALAAPPAPGWGRALRIRAKKLDHPLVDKVIHLAERLGRPLMRPDQTDG